MTPITAEMDAARLLKGDWLAVRRLGLCPTGIHGVHGQTEREHSAGLDELHAVAHKMLRMRPSQ